MYRWYFDKAMVRLEAERGKRQLDEWAQQAQDDPYQGYCLGCGAHRRRSESRQVERDETCVYACAVCGETLDELPF